MEKYCTIRKKDINNIENYAWDFGKSTDAFQIYKKILEKYYLPVSVREQNRMINGISNEEAFCEIINRIYYARESGKEKNQDIVVRKIIKDEEIVRDYIDSVEVDLETVTETVNINIEDKASIIRKLNNTGDNLPDNPLQSIIRDMICKRSLYLYLDICQSMYYSLSYYEVKNKECMTLLNPFGDKNSEVYLDFYDKWQKYRKKGADNKNREKKSKEGADDTKNKNSNENKRIKKDIAYKRQKEDTKLSNIGVEMPFDTDTIFEYGDKMKIMDFAPDIIRFFVMNPQMIDLFSKKRKNRWTVSDYEKEKIENFLDKFYYYEEDPDEIVSQYLLQEYFGISISENICDFMEVILNIEKITASEIKSEFIEEINDFVRELRKCKPLYSKILILEKLFFLLRQGKAYSSYQGDEEKFISAEIKKLKHATVCLRGLIQELNYTFLEFTKCLFYPIYINSNKDIASIRQELKHLILETKRKLHIEKIESYEKLESQVFKNVERKKLNVLFPYVQKAMMTEL